MKFVKLAALAIIVLLSGLAGIAKVMQMPQEVEFFNSAGLGTVPLMILGIAQIIGAAAVLIKKGRPIGAFVVGTCFLISAVIILVTGQYGFAAVSLIPAALAVFVFYTSRAASTPT